LNNDPSLADVKELGSVFISVKSFLQEEKNKIRKRVDKNAGIFVVMIIDKR